MKTLAVALAALSFASTAAAQTPPLCGSTNRDNLVLADLGLHVIGAGYQRRLSCRFAVQGSLDYYRPWTITFGGDWPADTNVDGFGLRVRGFYYPFGRAPTGLWLSPFAQVMGVSSQRLSQKVTGAALAVGVSVGYAWLPTDWLHIAVGVGVQYHAATLGTSAALEDTSTPPSFHGFWPTADINVGYAF